MNRERAETYLRLLAEAETRELTALPSAMSWSRPWPAGITCPKLQVVALALTTVDALDAGTAEAILADFDLAVNARQLRRGRAWPAGGLSGPRALPRPIQSKAAGPLTAGPPGTAWLGYSPATATARASAAAGPAAPGPKGAGGSGPERFVAVGLTIPFRHAGMSDDLYLMSYAHTAAGARFTVTRHVHGPVSMGVATLGLCTVTDDRGGRYQLDFTGTSSGPEWTGLISLHPDPPGDLRWLDICPPSGTAVRVGLDPSEAAGSDGAAADVRAADVRAAELGPGEHLLTLIAERLLHDLRLLRHGIWHELAASAPGPFGHVAAGLGEVVAALEAAEALAPASPLPGRLAALCANLGISELERAVPPVPDLPEQWLSLLAHYHRRKPENAPFRDGLAAALAAPLPELDGIRLALLGVHNAEMTTFVHVLASGLTRNARHGPFGIDMSFPLSVWIRDSGGRWHLARPDGLHRTGGEDILRLRLTPPLTRPTAWIEVLAAGRSAQVRAKVPLRWENSP